MQDFRFTNTSSRRNIGAAADLLVQPRLWIPGGDYPDHTKITNRGIINFVVEQGYRPLPPSKVEGSFAHNGVPDVAFVKQLSPLEIA